MPQTNNLDGNALLPHNNNDGLLSLKEIGERLDVGYGRLRGFADVPGLGDVVGAVNVRGVKGVRYEPRAAEMFGLLIAAQDAGEVTPATAKGWLTRRANDAANAPLPQPGNEMATRHNAPLPQPGTDNLLPAVVRILERLTQDAPAEDRLILSEEAAALLACRPRSVGRFVRPVLPGRWRRSDLLKYIAGLSQR